MGLFDRMIGKAINDIASPLINEATKHVVKQVKDSGVIESTVDDITVSMTNNTRYAKIMRCKFCGREYDNTEEVCPGCGAPNENRKYDYQNKDTESKGVDALSQFGNRVKEISNAPVCINCKYGKPTGFMNSKYRCLCSQSVEFNKIVHDSMDGARNAAYPGGIGCNCFDRR